MNAQLTSAQALQFLNWMMAKPGARRRVNPELHDALCDAAKSLEGKGIPHDKANALTVATVGRDAVRALSHILSPDQKEKLLSSILSFALDMAKLDVS